MTELEEKADIGLAITVHLPAEQFQLVLGGNEAERAKFTPTVLGDRLENSLSLAITNGMTSTGMPVAVCILIPLADRERILAGQDVEAREIQREIGRGLAALAHAFGIGSIVQVTAPAIAAPISPRGMVH